MSEASAPSLDPRLAAWLSAAAPVAAAALVWLAAGWSAERVDALDAARAGVAEARRLSDRLRAADAAGDADADADAAPVSAVGALARIEEAAEGLGDGSPLRATTGSFGGGDGPGADAVEVRLDGLTLADTLTLLDRLAAEAPPLPARRLTLEPSGDPTGRAWSVGLTVEVGGT